MSNIARKMDFDVYTDLKEKTNQYNIIIDLENEVDSYTRELAITLAGSIVRNNFKRVYKTILNEKELSEMIKSKLNIWVPREKNFKAINVVASPKQVKSR